MQPENVTRWPILGAACIGSATSPSATSPTAIAISHARMLPSVPGSFPRQMRTQHPCENATEQEASTPPWQLERNLVVHVAALAAGADGRRLAGLGSG